MRTIPEDCRNRLQAEGKPFPKSGCKVCGSIIDRGCPFENEKRRVFITMDFDGHYPVGQGAVAIAETEQQARSLLDAEIRKRGLPGFPAGSLLIELRKVGAVVLCDGSY